MLQELTYGSKPKRALEEFMKCDNAQRGCGPERGGVPLGDRALEEKDTPVEFTFKIKGLAQSVWLSG